LAAADDYAEKAEHISHKLTLIAKSNSIRKGTKEKGINNSKVKFHKKRN